MAVESKIAGSCESNEQHSKAVETELNTTFSVKFCSPAVHLHRYLRYEYTPYISA